MGMVTEIHAVDGAVYWIVSVFPGAMRDAKWMAVEDRLKEARPPQELCSMIEAVLPIHRGRFPPAGHSSRLLDGPSP